MEKEIFDAKLDNIIKYYYSLSGKNFFKQGREFLKIIDDLGYNYKKTDTENIISDFFNWHTNGENNKILYHDLKNKLIRMYVIKYIEFKEIKKVENCKERADCYGFDIYFTDNTKLKLI